VQLFDWDESISLLCREDKTFLSCDIMITFGEVSLAESRLINGYPWSLLVIEALLLL